MEMEMEFYVNTDMHVYVYVCVRDDSRDLEAGACFWSSFLSWYVKKLSDIGTKSISFVLISNPSHNLYPDPL